MVICCVARGKLRAVYLQQREQLHNTIKEAANREDILVSLAGNLTVRASHCYAHQQLQSASLYTTLSVIGINIGINIGIHSSKSSHFNTIGQLHQNICIQLIPLNFILPGLQFCKVPEASEPIQLFGVGCRHTTTQRGSCHGCGRW
jgi:hypothetical protein